MGRNLVPRANKGADLGTPEKNWNKLYVDSIALQNEDLKTVVDGKVDKNILQDKGDLYTATAAGTIVRLPRGADGQLLTTNSLKPEGLEWKAGDVRQPLTQDLEVTVGAGGDFGTINQAIDSITSLYVPKYLSGGIVPRVTIRLLPGFVMSEQVLIDSLDLSWITITGVDDETVINRSALTKNFYGEGYPAFGVADGGFLPIINQLFNMNTSGEFIDRHGISIGTNSRAIIFGNCGIKNAGGNGMFASNAWVYACAANFSGAGVYGIYTVGGSLVSAINANVLNTGSHGLAVYDGSIIFGLGAKGTTNTAVNTISASGIIFGPLAS